MEEKHFKELMALSDLIQRLNAIHYQMTLEITPERREYLKNQSPKQIDLIKIQLKTCNNLINNSL